MKELKHRIPAPPTMERIQDIEGLIADEADCLIFNMSVPARIPACFKSIPAEEIAYVFENEQENAINQKSLLIFLPVKARPYFTVVTLGFSERRELIASAIELAPWLIKLLIKLMKMPAAKKAKLKYGDVIKKSGFKEDDYYPDPGNLLVVPVVDGYAPERDKSKDSVELMQLITKDTIGIWDKKATPEDFSKRLRVEKVGQLIDCLYMFTVTENDPKSE